MYFALDIQMWFAVSVDLCDFDFLILYFRYLFFRSIYFDQLWPEMNIKSFLVLKITIVSYLKLITDTCRYPLIILFVLYENKSLINAVKHFL